MIISTYKRGGKWLSLEHFKNDRKHGLQWEWNPVSELMLSETPYKGGLLHGTVRHWHFNGRLKSEQFFHKGAKHGFERAFHGNGRLMREMLWLNGKRLGSERTWSLDGGLYMEDPPNGSADIRLDKALFGRDISERMDGPTMGMFDFMSDQKHILFDVVIAECPMPTDHEMALASIAANKAKRWHHDGLDPEEIRMRILGVDETKDNR